MSYVLRRAISSLRRQTMKIAVLYRRGILPSLTRLRNLRKSINYLEMLLRRELSGELPRDKARKMASILTFFHRTLLAMSYGKPVKGTFMIKVDYEKRKIVVKTVLEPIFGKKKEKVVTTVELP